MVPLWNWSFILALGLFLTGCKPAKAPPPDALDVPKTYAVRGVVQALASDQHHATIRHEAIPGYMPAMTMDLSVKNPAELKGLAAGDEIAFTLVVTASDDWIEKVRSTGKTTAPAPAPAWHVVEAELQVGDTLPDCEFTDETGRTIRFSDFHGRAVAFTFFFTSCPLPEFCPRMNRNFFEARKLLMSDTSAPTNWQFLSVSFDSSFDTPQILAGYGKYFRQDNPDRWLFAVASTNTLASLGPKVDLRFWRENGTISHNLRTVVLDGGGRIFKQFDGNDWTPSQLAEALVAAAQPKGVRPNF